MAQLVLPEKTLVQKVLVTAIWIAASAVVSYLATLFSGNPQWFGVWFPVVNLVLVALKNLIDPNVPNV